MAILKAFTKQLERFAALSPVQPARLRRLKNLFPKPQVKNEPITSVVPRDIVQQREPRVSLRVVFQAFVLLLLLYSYVHHTWDVDIADLT